MYSFKRIFKALAWLAAGSPAQKRRVRLELARVAAGIFGDHYVGEDYKLWRTDAGFLQEYKRLSPGNPYSQDRKYLLREIARAVKDIPGSIAECGCYEGASAFFMAGENPDVPLHLFDSFEGLSDPVDEDNAKEPDILRWKRGDLRSTEEKARSVLSSFENVYFHRGWIPSKFDEVAREQFRLVHIDVDLYEPTRDSLEFFYPRLSPGGAIVMDDYGFSTCPGAHRAATEYMADKPESIIHSPTGQGIIFRR